MHEEIEIKKMRCKKGVQAVSRGTVIKKKANWSLKDTGTLGLRIQSRPYD